MREAEVFCQLGFEATIMVAVGSDSDVFLDQWLDEAIERSGLLCGGGGGEETRTFFVFRPAETITERHRLKVEEWLREDRDVVSFKVGPLVDANEDR